MKEGRITVPKTRLPVESKQVIDKAFSVSTFLKPVTFVLTRLFFSGGGEAALPLGVKYSR